MEEVMPMIARWRGSDAAQSRRRCVRFTEGVRRRCKKSSSSVLSFKRTTVAAKSGQFTAGETGKGSSSEKTEGIW